MTSSNVSVIRDVKVFIALLLQGAVMASYLLLFRVGKILIVSNCEVNPRFTSKSEVAGPFYFAVETVVFGQ
jgi:hypothetical protein